MASSSESYEEETWTNFAKREQMRVTSFFKKMDETSYYVLKSRLAVALFGIPHELEKESETLSYTHYGKKEQGIVKRVAKCLLDNQDKRAANDMCIYSFVLIVGRQRSTKEIFKTWVLRTPADNSLEEKFIDIDCRVYCGWKSYLKQNTLPAATICYPFNGRYTGANENLVVEFAETPACSTGKKVLFGLDIASVVSGTVATGITTASLFLPVATPFVMAAFGTSLLAGAYGAGRSIETLVDRDKHGQTISFLDTQARSAWLGATLPFVGIAAGGASALAATAPKLGITMSQAAKTALNVTNGANCFAHGIFFAHDIYGIIEYNNNSYKVTHVQIMQCIASALFFANVIVTTHQARMLLNSMPVETGQGVFESVLNKLGLTKVTENGINVRPTNFLVNANVLPLLATVVKWGNFVLNIPLPISSSINEIIHFIHKSSVDEKITFAAFIAGLFPLLKTLWTCISDHIQNESTFENCKFRKYTEENSFRGTNTSSEKQNTFENCTPGFQKYTERNTFKDTNTSNIKEQFSECSTEAPNINKITITDLEYGTNETEVQKVLKHIPGKEKMTSLEILNITRLFLERVRKDVQQKEEEFQNILKVSGITKKKLENSYKISGNRTQHFVNKVMESYTDFKLLALTQDYEKLLKNDIIQIPLFEQPTGTVKIKCYTSLQRSGTHEQKYRRILQQAGVDIHPSCITYGAENAYFVEFQDIKSEYIMVGLMNFVEGEKMSGIIVLQKRAS